MLLHLRVLGVGRCWPYRKSHVPHEVQPNEAGQIEHLVLSIDCTAGLVDFEEVRLNTLVDGQRVVGRGDVEQVIQEDLRR